MRVFSASYMYIDGHSWVAIEYIVVAATMYDVLPDVMKKEPDSIEELWEIEEIDTTKRSCTKTYHGVY